MPKSDEPVEITPAHRLRGAEAVQESLARYHAMCVHKPLRKVGAFSWESNVTTTAAQKDAEARHHAGMAEHAANEQGAIALLLERQTERVEAMKAALA